MMALDASAPSLEKLLERLHEGDTAAAAELFLHYEPYLRMVVRRKLSAELRAKFDSADVVQSVWADLLRGVREAGWRFPDPARLKAFLIRATVNRFIDRLRQNLDEVQHQQRLPGEDAEGTPASSLPGPSQCAEAQELWDWMVELCPPAHVELLNLRRQGWPLAEIAARCGLHPSSVRRIFYDLARRLSRAGVMDK